MIKYKVTQQKSAFCGPASLKIVFDYYGVVKSQDEWARLSGATVKDGVQNDGMVKAIKKVGFIPNIIKEASFGDLKKLVKQNRTFLVIWWSGGGGHYSPVVDITEKSIILADPGFGRYRRVGLKNFDHLWFDFAKDYERSPEDLELRSILLITKPC